MGATNSTRKLTIDSIALLEMLEPNTAEAVSKARAQQKIQAILAKEWPTCRVLPFGSSKSGLGFGGSDLDLGIYFDDVGLDDQSHFTPSDRIQILSTVCTRLGGGGAFEIKEFVQQARIPVVKLWDPEGQILCDLCIGSVHVLLNTALLKHYGRSDPRVRPLAFAVKYWAKQRGINDSVNGTLSSYGFMLMLIFFLQSSRAQALLSPVGSIFRSLDATKMSLSSVVSRLDSLSVATTVDSTFGTLPSESVGALLSGFFAFYANEFNHEDDVVSVRMGHSLPKATTWSRPVPWRLSIEDPFEQSHDVGRVVFSHHGQTILHREFVRAHEMTTNGHRLADICARDESAWNWAASCYICLSSTHTARDCSPVWARGMMDGSVAAAGDCWYCGGAGHVKATCPLYAYVAIPNPLAIQSVPSMVDVAAVPVQACPVHFVSTPVPIGAKNPDFQVVWPSNPSSHSPVGGAQKKKKRQRRGSVSSVASSPEQQRSRKYMLAAAGQLCSTEHKRGRNPSKRTALPGRVPCIT